MAMKVGTVVKKNRRCKATRTNDLDSSSIDLDIPASAREVRYQERGGVQGLYLNQCVMDSKYPDFLYKLKLYTYLWDASLTSFLSEKVPATSVFCCQHCSFSSSSIALSPFPFFSVVVKFNIITSNKNIHFEMILDVGIGEKRKETRFLI